MMARCWIPASFWLFELIERRESCQRFEQVVDRVHFEGFHGILIKGRREDNFRQGNFLIEQLLNYAEAVKPRHLHIKKDEIGIVFADEIDGFDAVLALSHDVHIVDVLEQISQLIPGQLLIIHDYGRKRHSCSSRWLM